MFTYCNYFYDVLIRNYKSTKRIINENNNINKKREIYEIIHKKNVLSFHKNIVK